MGNILCECCHLVQWSAWLMLQQEKASSEAPESPSSLQLSALLDSPSLQAQTPRGPQPLHAFLTYPERESPDVGLNGLLRARA